MSVNQRGASWQVDVKHKGKRVRAQFASYDEAIKYEEAARLALKEGKPVPPTGSASGQVTTLAQLFRKVYLLHWKGTKAEHKHLANIKLWERFLGSNISISEITTQVLDDYILMMKENNKANATINRHLATISKAMTYAADNRLISYKPKINRQKEGQGRIRYLSRDEEKAILNQLTSMGMDDLKDAFIVSIDVGCRFSELMKLTASDIKKQGVYLTDRKAGNHSVIPLTERARAILKRRAAFHPEGKLFPYSGDWIRSPYTRVLNILGLDDVVWHTLRHTTCSRLVQGGMPLVHVKEWMGHKAIQTTMRYAHLSTAHLSSGVSILDSVA